MASTAQLTDVEYPRDSVSSRSRAWAISEAVFTRTGRDFLEVARTAIELVESAAERNRRTLAHRRTMIMQDAWAPLLKASMENWFRAETADAIMGAERTNLDISMNPMRDILSEIGVLYLTAPTREGEGDSAADYAKLMEGTGFDAFWATVDQMSEYYNDLVIWPSVVERNGKRVLKHRWAAGDSYSVVVNTFDRSEVEATIIRNPLGQGAVLYSFWTDDWHGEFLRSKERNSGGKLEVVIRQVGPAQDGFENPYGESPFVHIHRTPRFNSYWDTTTGEDLIELNLGIGQLRTLTRYSWKMSSFKQGVVTGEMLRKIPKQLRDEGAILKLQGENILFQVVDWQFDSGQRRDWIDSDVRMAAASRGINPERLKRTGNYQTATDAKLGDRGLIERRQKKKPIFEQAEREYYRKAVIVSDVRDVAGARALKLDKDSPVNVRHAQMEYPTDPQARLNFFLAAAASGVESLTGYVLANHPTWSKDEAIQFIKENVKELAAISTIKVERRADVPDDLTNDSATAEQTGRQGPITRDSTDSSSETTT